MEKKFLKLLFIATLGGMPIACKHDAKKEAPVTLIDESTIAVNMMPVHEGVYNYPIVSSGLISTETESRLSFKIGGMISSILVVEGQAITKGQLLASLDLTEINAQLAQARNGLEKSKRDLERGQRLFKDSAATLEQLQNLQTGYDAAQENFTIASFNKRFATIHANASGKVIRKFVNEGEQITAGAPALIINSSAQNNWIVKIGLSDVDWVRVKKGDPAKIFLDAYPGEVFDGEVSLINEGADQLNGLYHAEVKIKTKNKRLASGLFARVEIFSSNGQLHQGIPIEALVEGNGKNAFVFIANDDHKSVKKIPVTVAYITSDSAVISNGLENVKEVITSGSAFLTEFSTIHIVKK
jgi:membrane fusion protein, multidrug efflux system